MNFPKLARKVVLRLCLQIFSHNDHEDLFWCDLQVKNGLHLFFSKRCAGAIF